MKILSNFIIFFWFVSDFVTGVCSDNLPSVISRNSDCKKLKLSCDKFKNKCGSKLGVALKNLKSSRRCKKALKRNSQKRVNEFCTKTCQTRGKFSNSYLTGSRSRKYFRNCLITRNWYVRYFFRFPWPEVDGNWGSWISDSECQCFQKRTRLCNNPKPLGGGASCPGSNSKRTECIPGEWKKCIITQLNTCL